MLKFDNMHLTWNCFPCYDVNVVHVHGNRISRKKPFPTHLRQKKLQIRYKFRPHGSQTPFLQSLCFQAAYLGRQEKMFSHVFTQKKRTSCAKVADQQRISPQMWCPTTTDLLGSRIESSPSIYPRRFMKRCRGCSCVGRTSISTSQTLPLHFIRKVCTNSVLHYRPLAVNLLIILPKAEQTCDDNVGGTQSAQPPI